MKRAAALLLFLAGCSNVTPEGQAQVIAAQEIQYCNGLGAVTQEQVFQCRLQVQNQKYGRRVAANQAMGQLGIALMAQGNQPAPYIPPPRTCRSFYAGGVVTTRCF